MVKISIKWPSCIGKGNPSGILRRRTVAVITAFFFLVAITLIIYEAYVLLQNTESISSSSLVHEEDVQSSNLKYSIVVDAGSSGSRAYVYVWPPHNGNPRELLHIQPLRNKQGQPIVKKIEPGLSSVADNPSLASDYISPLLSYVAQYIPSERHKETPLYILATAGLRLLDSSTQKAILDDLKTDIPKNFSFSFASTNAEVISGKQEGVYQWIAINFVLDRFDHKTDGPLVAVDLPGSSSENPIIFRQRTVSILDMGGASMQVAFEVTNKIQIQGLQEDLKTNLAEFNLGCLEHGIDHLYRVYVTTYLGLGANSVRQQYVDHLIMIATKNKTEWSVGSTPIYPIHDPCLPRDLVQNFNITVTVADEQNNGTSSSFIKQVFLKGSGDFNSCRNSLLPILRNLTGCPGRNCTLSKLPINFGDSEFYGFSEFWYSMEDVLRIGGKYNYHKFYHVAKEFCSTRWPTLEDRYRKHLYPLADLSRFHHQCFKSVWIVVVLHEGLGIGRDTSNLQSSPNAIGGKVVHWTLGAALYRTRFFPLQTIQRENLVIATRSMPKIPNVYLNQYILILCFLLVGGSIFLYLRGLRCLHPRIPRSTSQNYFPVLDDPLEKGLLSSRNYYS